MNYKELSKHLQKSVLPNEWEVIEHSRNGVYLWPKNIDQLKDAFDKSLILRNHSMLFEFHVTDAGSARILARARFNAKPDKFAGLDERWKRLWILARCSKADDPENTPRTRSVAVWKENGLQQIGKNTKIEQVASLIRKFLQEPPDSLARFIEKLKSDSKSIRK